ncbi:molybdopterin synthase catalytic subunit-like [Camellia sinensis]|uniref:molybdopterin synthase catalytic subunit-like n=1 Tax=Camellia sinensis TaxID=4442 RepID=UPI001035661D|nr:molybdopterin synthase catalytic subunit-like [Camellia sinensis]
MAIRRTKSICSSARSSWNLHSIAVAHRLRPIPVGHTSVFIAVSAVHRAEALDAYKEGWKENSEFLERRIQIVKGNGVCSERKKGCCAVKVKGKSGASDSCDN